MGKQGKNGCCSQFYSDIHLNHIVSTVKANTVCKFCGCPCIYEMLFWCVAKKKRMKRRASLFHTKPPKQNGEEEEEEIITTCYGCQHHMCHTDYYHGKIHSVQNKDNLSVLQ